MARAGTITVEVRLIDHVTPELDKLAWRLLVMDGNWHREQMRPAPRRPK